MSAGVRFPPSAPNRIVEEKRMEVLLMVIFVLAYFLTAFRTMIVKNDVGSVVLAVVVNITSFAGMMLILLER